MVEMYVWLLVTLVVAVGVLMLAGIVSPGDSADDADDARGTPASAWSASAWSSLWRDFRSGTSTLQARWDRLRHRAGRGTGPDSSPHRVSVLADDDGARPGRLPARGAPARGAPASDTGAAETSSTSWRDLEPAESNTSFDEFFEATATSEPAYLDAAQLSDALNSLRR